VRLRIQIGDWQVLRGPIEVAFDRTHHDLIITTLATHPLRARAVIELRPDDQGGTFIKQTNRYQLGVASFLAGRVLGLEERIASFWQGFLDALRVAAEMEPVPSTASQRDRDLP
jgi:hypothetical protein